MKRKMPTKQQIKAARAKRRKGFALLREAGEVLHKLRREQRRRRGAVARRRVDDAVETFHTWQHDFNTFLPAVARSAAYELLTPGEIIVRATQAADQMKAIVAARRPDGAGDILGVRRDGRRGPVRDWLRWQSAFDGFVHDMCDRATMPASQIIDRAVELADLSIAEVEKRRPGKRKAAP